MTALILRGVERLDLGHLAVEAQPDRQRRSESFSADLDGAAWLDGARAHLDGGCLGDLGADQLGCGQRHDEGDKGRPAPQAAPPGTGWMGSLHLPA